MGVRVFEHPALELWQRRGEMDVIIAMYGLIQIGHLSAHRAKNRGAFALHSH